MADYDLTGIQLNVELAGEKEAVKDLDKLIKQLEGMGVKVNVGLDTEDIRKEVKKASHVVTKELNASTKINPQLNQQAFSDLYARLAKVRSEVDELAKVDIMADKNGNIQKAVLMYQDGMGKAVTETMGFRNVLNETGELVSKIFETQGFKFTDNIAKQNVEIEKQIKKEEKLLSVQQEVENSIAKIGNMRKQYGDIVDSDELDLIEDAFKSLDVNSKNSIDNVDKLKSEVKDLSKYLNDIDKSSNKTQTKRNQDRDKFTYSDLVNNRLGIDDKSVTEASNLNKKMMLENAKLEKSSDNARLKQEALYESVRKLKETKIAYDVSGLDDFVNQLDNIDINSEEAMQKLNELSKAFTRLSNNANESSSKVNLVDNIKSQLSKLDSITIANDRFDVDIYKNIKTQYEELIQEIESGNVSLAQARDKFDKLAPSVKGFENATKSASDTTNSLSDRINRYFQFNFVSESVQLMKRGIREVVQTVGELDSSLVELQKVSDLTGDSLDAVTDRAYKMGDTLARTGKDVIDAVTTAKRAGYELEDSFQLGEQSLVMMNVAENITSVESATGSLVAVLRGYGKEVGDVTHLVDAFNEVSNTQAVNFDDLVDGATRISGVMNQQGNSFEEMLGMLTGGYEVNLVPHHIEICG